MKKKNPEIPKLPSYDKDPGEEFWKKFPFRALPVKPESNVNGELLKEKFVENAEKLTNSQLKRGFKAANMIIEGAHCCQRNDLPACMQKNADNTLLHGEAVTDTVASWIKDKFVAGPFKEPPTSKFRVNCLMAIDQGLKIRPVLNGSLPENNSLNSNVDPAQVEQVEMCSARCFSYSVKEAGVNAYIAKMDMQNAYKNVPCVPSEYRLQGFHWLGRYFVETTQIFGAKTAVCNFDVLGNSLLTLTLTECSIHRSLVHRQLDDVPVVAPEHRKFWCEEFVQKYKNNCESVGISLAEDDPNCDKAFSLSQEGKVLGIYFRTEDLSWAYPSEKKLKLLKSIVEFLDSKKVSLLQMQCLMGRINDVCLMIPFLKCYKHSLNALLSWLQLHPNCLGNPSEQSRKDARVWARFLQDVDEFHPICPRPAAPPISHFCFTSDAAGFSELTPFNVNVGVGVVGFNPDDEICFAHQSFWPKELFQTCDAKGASYGSKTLFLEFVGLIIPFLLIPKLLKNSHVVLNVDNIGCYYAWQNRTVKNDVCAAILVRALVVISAFLEIQVHVKHLPRMSSWDARLCDRMSRSHTTTSQDRRLLNNFKDLDLPIAMKNWLKKPVENWDLCMELLDCVKEKING